MSTVVRLAEFRSARAGRSSDVDTACHQRDAAAFTLWDRCALEGWAGRDRHVTFDMCELGAFAMLYRRGTAWASWGVVRQDRDVLVWDCVTHADIGRFQSMADALAALPIPRGPTTRSVLPFAASPPRYVASR